MKPIKFRGKCLDTGEMVVGKLVTGSYVEIAGYALIVSESTWDEYHENSDGCSKIMEAVERGTTYRIACKVYSVDKTSIAQLVGYDADGAEVYEGDVVQAPDGESYLMTISGIAYPSLVAECKLKKE